MDLPLNLNNHHPHPPRRPSHPFSLALPFSRRRTIRYISLFTLALLSLLLVGERRRVRRIHRLLEQGGGGGERGWGWVGWDGNGLARRVVPRRAELGVDLRRSSGLREENEGELGKREDDYDDDDDNYYEGQGWEERLNEGLRGLGLGAFSPLPLSSSSSSSRNPPSDPPHPSHLDLDRSNDRPNPNPPSLAQGQRRMPTFYGNPDEVGRSPFDSLPPFPPAGSSSSSGRRDMDSNGNGNGNGRREGRGAGKRVLFLTDYHDYLERMNTHTYELVDSALRHPFVHHTDVWGPGWNGWDEGVDLSENVRRRGWRVAQMRGLGRDEGLGQGRDGDGDGNEGREGETMKDWLDRIGKVPPGCPGQTFDLVWTISDIFKQTSPLLSRPLPCNSLLAQQLGDCHSLNCLREWYPHTSNITVTKYAFEMIDIFNPARLEREFEGMEMQLFGHSPDSANEWDFHPGEGEREGVVLFGFTGSFYPLRTTITNAIDETPEKTIVRRFTHPGYTIWEDPRAYSDPLETYTPDHPYYQKHLAMRRDFATGLRSAKICVFDSSLERKMIRKYSQAFLSGCVVAGDIPTEQEDQLGEFMIQLHPDWDIEKIDEVLREALRDEDELKRKAFLGFAYARRYLTNTNKITQMLRLVDKYNEGVRGYDLPYGFSLRCRAYWSDEDSYRPPWCQGYRGLEGRSRS